MKIILILFTVVVFISCTNKNTSTCYYSTEPPTLFFLIQRNNKKIADSILQNTKLSYFENGTKKYITDIYNAIGDYANKGVLTSRTVGIQSSEKNTKTYYLEFPNGLPTDTLYIDYSAPSPSNNCRYILQSFKLNNKTVSIDTSFRFQPVYVLNH